MNGAWRATERVSADLADRHRDFLALMADMVSIDSGPDAPDGVRQVNTVIADRLADIARIEWADTDGVTHLRATIPGSAGRATILGHSDTVFLRGVAAERPLRVTDGLCFGPGVADMKGALAMATLTMEALHRMGGHPTIELIVVGDEETRTIVPPWIHDMAGTDACFVLECGRPGGGYIVRRKAGSWVRLVSVGASAHAGVKPEAGHSAIVALCRAVVAISELNLWRGDVTVSVGTIQGGTAPNVVAESATALLDIRATDSQDLAGTAEAVQTLANAHGLEFVDLGSWPPMDSTGSEIAVRYEELAERAGHPVEPQGTGGMSDGCWVAAAGVPTIDGLGPEGGDDHSPNEFLDLATVAPRAGLLAGSIMATNSGRTTSGYTASADTASRKQETTT